MPELPEVETVVRDLRPMLTGRSIVSVRRGRQRLRRSWKPSWDRLVEGRTIESIRRRGKWIVIDLDHDRRLLVHLGMTGQLTAVDPATPGKEDHVHLVFALDDGRVLRFRDIRRFGSIVLHDAASLEGFFRDSRLGPEPNQMDAAAWTEKLRTTKRTLKAVLLDQTVVAGVGNIYADESLFHACLHPTRRGADLSETEAVRLLRTIAVVLDRAIEGRGSTIRDYVGGSGLRGGYQDEFRVYGRTGKTCVVCNMTIEQMRLAGRSTHYCPCCQR